jgi:hypothetical protein
MMNKQNYRALASLSKLRKNGAGQEGGGGSAETDSIISQFWRAGLIFQYDETKEVDG